MKPSLFLRPGSLVLLFLWLAGGLVARAQAPVWQSAVTAAGTVAVQATATDGTNIYLAGSFSGTAVFGGTTLTAATAQEAFVAKWLPATNSFAWVVQGNGTGTGLSAATALACSGNTLFVAGNFTNSTWGLNGGPTVTNAQVGTSDGFVAQLFDNGPSATAGWTNRLGGTSNDYVNALMTIGLTVYVGGSNGTNANFDANTNLSNAGGYVVAYQGFFGRLAFQPVPAGGAVMALATTGANVYAAGSFGSSTATFVDGSHTLASAGGDDAFVARLSSNLGYGWAQRAGGTGADYARAVLVRNGYLYVAGSFASASASFGSTTLTNAGTGALFVARLADTNTGTFTWALQNGGGTSPYTSAYALASYGTSVYVAGTVGGTATFGSTTLTSAGLSDVLLAKVTDSGSSAAFAGAQQAGGAGADYAYGLVALKQQLYTVGQVTAPASFGTQTIGTAVGPRPGFLALASDPAPLLNLVASNTGPAGTTVTLYGTGLSGTTAIAFAGAGNNVVTSGFTVNAAGTQISGVVVPSGAQSGPVSATTAQGTSNGLISFTVAPANPAPAWKTAVAAGGAGSTRYTQPDASGNIVVTGIFNGSLVLGATTLTSAGGTDIFVAKYNPATSSYVWAQGAGSAGDDVPYGLAVQGSSVYVAGTFEGQSAMFGRTKLTAVNGNGGFLTKLTDAGSSADFTWAQGFDDAVSVYVEGLAVSGTSVYVSGDHLGASLPLGSGTLTGNASGDDGFVAKFTDNGAAPTFNWAKSMGSAPNSTSFDTFFGYGLVVRGSTLYLAGYLTGTVSFDNVTLTAAGPSDVAVVRLTDAGNSATFTAGLRTGGTGQELARSMVGQGDALYVAGFSDSATWPGTTATNAGSEDAFVLKVTDTGTALTLGWVQLLGGANLDLAYQVAVNGTSVYVAGYFVGSATFGSTTLVGAGSNDGFVARLVDAGSSVSVAWAQAAGGLANDECTSLAIKNGNVYVGGSVVPNAAFGSLVLTSSLRLSTPVLASISDPAVLAAVPARPATLAASLPLYPNPAHDHTTVPVAFGTTSLRLLDALGHEVRQQPVAAGAAEVALDLRGLAAGLYLVQARGAGGASQAQHLVVE